MKTLKQLIVLQKETIQKVASLTRNTVWSIERSIQSGEYWSEKDLLDSIQVEVQNELETIEQNEWEGFFYFDSFSTDKRHPPTFSYRGAEFPVSRYYVDVDRGCNVFEVIVEKNRIEEIKNYDKCKEVLELLIDTYKEQLEQNFRNLSEQKNGKKLSFLHPRKEMKS